MSHILYRINSTGKNFSLIVIGIKRFYCPVTAAAYIQCVIYFRIVFVGVGKLFLNACYYVFLSVYGYGNKWLRHFKQFPSQCVICIYKIRFFLLLSEYKFFIAIYDHSLFSESYCGTFFIPFIFFHSFASVPYFILLIMFKQ